MNTTIHANKERIQITPYFNKFMSIPQPNIYKQFLNFYIMSLLFIKYIIFQFFYEKKNTYLIKRKIFYIY